MQPDAKNAVSPSSQRVRREPTPYRHRFLEVVQFDPLRRGAHKRSLFESIRSAILSGELPPGTQLPSTRSIAANARISRNAVVEIFERLVADGLVRARVGSGTYVCAQAAPRELAPASRRPVHLSRVGRSLLRAWAAQRSAPPGVGALRPGQPALDRFPAAAWGRYLARAARLPATDLLGEATGGGNLELRRQIADRLRITRDVHCSADHVVIVPDTLQATTLLAHVVVDPGEIVCLEDPNVTETGRVFAAAGAELAYVGLDLHGFDVAAAAARKPPRLIHVTPSHQAATGAMMSSDRRRTLVAWASAVDALIVEDDTGSDVCHDDRSVPAIHSFDADGRVAYIGTFSASMVPSVTIAYIVAPPNLATALIAAQRLQNLSANVVEQAALAAFIGDGVFARHIADMKAVYMERRTALLYELDVQMRDVLSPQPSAYGLRVLALLPSNVDDAAICRHAALHGLFPQPLSPRFVATTPKPGLLLGFGSSLPAQLRKDISALQKCVRQASRGARVAP